MTRKDIYKLAGLIGAVLVAVAAHKEVLPDLLKPYEGWIELAAFVASTAQAYLMIPKGVEDGRSGN